MKLPLIQQERSEILSSVVTANLIANENRLAESVINEIEKTRTTRTQKNLTTRGVNDDNRWWFRGYAGHLCRRSAWIESAIQSTSLIKKALFWHTLGAQDLTRNAMHIVNPQTFHAWANSRKTIAWQNEILYATTGTAHHRVNDSPEDYIIDAAKVLLRSMDRTIVGAESRFAPYPSENCLIVRPGEFIEQIKWSQIGGIDIQPTDMIFTDQRLGKGRLRSFLKNTLKAMYPTSRDIRIRACYRPTECENNILEHKSNKLQSIVTSELAGRGQVVHYRTGEVFCYNEPWEVVAILPEALLWNSIAKPERPATDLTNSLTAASLMGCAIGKAPNSLYRKIDPHMQQWERETARMGANVLMHIMMRTEYSWLNEILMKLASQNHEAIWQPGETYRHYAPTRSEENNSIDTAEVHLNNTMIFPTTVLGIASATGRAHRGLLGPFWMGGNDSSGPSIGSMARETGGGYVSYEWAANRMNWKSLAITINNPIMQFYKR